MRIEKYGITLHRLTKLDIELVRYWRNHPKIRQFMIFQEHITEQMQLKWFESIDNAFNFFFIVEVKGTKIGLIDVKNIDYEKKTAESGMFLWDEQFKDTYVTPSISMCISDFGFHLLQLDTAHIKVNRNNAKAIVYHKQYGQRLYEDDATKSFQKYSLSKVDYIQKSIKVKRTLEKLFMGQMPKIVLESKDEGKAYAQIVIDYYEKHSQELATIFTLTQE